MPDSPAAEQPAPSSAAEDDCSIDGELNGSGVVLLPSTEWNEYMEERERIVQSTEHLMAILTRPGSAPPRLNEDGSNGVPNEADPEAEPATDLTPPSSAAAPSAATHTPSSTGEASPPPPGDALSAFSRTLMDVRDRRQAAMRQLEGAASLPAAPVRARPPVAEEAPACHPSAPARSCWASLPPRGTGFKAGGFKAPRPVLMPSVPLPTVPADAHARLRIELRPRLRSIGNIR